MANTLTSLEIPAEVQAGIFSSVAEVSAFQKASKPVNLTWKGVTTHTLGGDRAKFVAEGAKKPVADGATAVTLIPQKLAVVDIYSNESESAAADAVAALKAEAGNSFARTIDHAIAGSTSVGTTSRINALSTAPTATVTDRASLIAAKSAASGVNPASAWVMSTTLKDQLDAMTNAQGGVLFPSLEASGTLLGLPVYTFTYSEAIGYVGDFANSAAFGIVAPPTGIVRVSKEGVFGNQSMAEENKTAVITELGVGFGVANANAFRKIVLAEEEVEG